MAGDGCTVFFFLHVVVANRARSTEEFANSHAVQKKDLRNFQWEKQMIKTGRIKQFENTNMSSEKCESSCLRVGSLFKLSRK